MVVMVTICEITHLPRVGKALAHVLFRTNFALDAGMYEHGVDF